MLRYLDFCPEFLGHVEKALIRKLILISKFMIISIEKQIIAIHILPNDLIKIIRQ